MAIFAFIAIGAALAALIACIPLATIRPAAAGTALELQRPTYGTVHTDAKAAWLDNYRRARGQWLRKKGRTLLANRDYAPHLHAGRVLELRRPA